MAKTYTTQEFASVYPEAFTALPEPYKNDSWLEFSDAGEQLICYPVKDQEPKLGRWVANYDANRKDRKWQVIYPSYP